MEPPLKILEGLIIPKSMKGAREAWVFIADRRRSPSASPCCSRLGVDRASPGVAVAGLALGGLLRTWLVKLSKSQLERLYTPLMPVAGRRRWPDRLLPGQVDARSSTRSASG